MVEGPEDRLLLPDVDAELWQSYGVPISSSASLRNSILVNSAAMLGVGAVPAIAGAVATNAKGFEVKVAIHVSSIIYRLIGNYSYENDRFAALGKGDEKLTISRLINGMWQVMSRTIEIFFIIHLHMHTGQWCAWIFPQCCQRSREDGSLCLGRIHYF
jgi:hypothetical protein